MPALHGVEPKRTKLRHQARQLYKPPKATATMKDSTPMQRPVAPDTTTKYTEEDGGMTQIESKLFTETSSMQVLYQETIRRGDIDNAEMLLPKLPSKNKKRGRG